MSDPSPGVRTKAPAAGVASRGVAPHPEPSPIRARFPVVLTRTRAFWPWFILAIVGWLGWHELRRINVTEVRELLHGTEPELILLLLFATAGNLAVAGLYDVAALGPLSRPPRPAARWRVGVISFSWSNFITLGPLAGPALRLWLYKPLGIDGERARAGLTAILSAFSLGLFAWFGAVAIPLPVAIDSFALRLVLAIPLGALTAGVLWMIPRLRFAPPMLRAWEGRPFVLAAVPLVDWLLAWVVFHLALGGLHHRITPALSLRAFFIGQAIGLLSFIPGGLFTSDLYWTLSLAGAVGGRDRIVAALLLYRCVYYVLPWAISSLVLAGQMIRTGRRTNAFLRAALASYSLLCGAILLASAATPALTDRMLFLRRTVPLPLVEISHGVSVVLGLLLLVISRGLARGYRSSHRLALALFLAGAITTFLKGFDFEEALIALAAAALLLVFHRSFTREGHLVPPVEFVFSVILFAIVLFAALGLGSQPKVPDVTSVFSRFEYLAHGPRFLRGLLLLLSLAGVTALHFATRSLPRDILPGAEEIDRALEEARLYSSGTNPLLIAGGDKAIFRAGGRSGAAGLAGGTGSRGGPGTAIGAGLAEGPGGVARPVEPGRAAGRSGDAREAPEPRGFIAYRSAGRFLVAYSDPVCPKEDVRDLLEAFLRYAIEEDRDVILYGISPSCLPVAHDFGFNFFKLGEEAIVDLTRWDLKGNKAKTWRHSINSIEKTGGRFEIVQGEALRPFLSELRSVSDQWLTDKHIGEMRFSIGRFDENYLLRFPCALVRDGSGSVIAFANILEGPRGEELSVDLMRYRSSTTPGGEIKNIMDYLFVKLMLLGKERGFTRFNLGMAPLSSVGEERWARPIEKMAHVFSRVGDHWYNYEGLRRFKEKFDPVWDPRYMAYPRPWDWPLAIATTAVLIAGGWRALLFPRGEKD